VFRLRSSGTALAKLIALPMFRQRRAHIRLRFVPFGVMLAGVLSAVVTLLFVVTPASAQTKYPIFTPENFADTMKTVGVNFSAVNAAVGKQDFATAKAQLIRSRERLALTITFWRDRKKDDAVKLLRDTLVKMDQLDTILSASSIDSVAASASVKQIAANCQSCHATYREQDASTHSYRFKPGLVQ